MGSTTYYWDEDDDNVCCEEDENGEITASYTHEAGLYGEVIAQKRGDEVRYFNFDGEGNTCELTDEDENVTDTYEYSAFGEEVARTGTTENPFGYKGALGYYANSETNDVYVRARTYRPIIGRWMSFDPLRGTWNKYGYVENNVINLVDPSGAISLGSNSPWLSPDLFISPHYCFGCEGFALDFTFYTKSQSRWFPIQHVSVDEEWFTCDTSCGACVTLYHCKCKGDFYENFPEIGPGIRAIASKVR